MQKKIYFIADAHLGLGTAKDSRERERKLVRWLDFVKRDASAVYLMGDILDFWFEYKNVVPRGFNRFFGKLAELTDEGIEIHWFIGNHDIWIFDYIPDELGVIVHKKPEEIDFSGKKFFLAHGDGLSGESKSFRFFRFLFHNRICQKLFACIHPRWAIALGHIWSGTWRKSFKECKDDKNFPHSRKDNAHLDRLVAFSKEYLKKRPDVHFFVYGHRHIMLNSMIAEKSRVIILGDWIKYFSYGVFDGADFEIRVFED